MKYEFFSPQTDPVLFTCQETGEKGIDPIFVWHLDELRRRCGFPFRINSGYRSSKHSIEAAKEQAGEHSRGAADVRITNSDQRFLIIKHAMALDFTGLGIAKNYIHVDRRKTPQKIWVY
jgi:zinc D-Ala-D-Ala carboxypeptidase